MAPAGWTPDGTEKARQTQSLGQKHPLKLGWKISGNTPDVLSRVSCLKCVVLSCTRSGSSCLDCQCIYQSPPFPIYCWRPVFMFAPRPPAWLLCTMSYLMFKLGSSVQASLSVDLGNFTESRVRTLVGLILSVGLEVFSFPSVQSPQF